jgi:hypothetical protein
MGSLSVVALVVAIGASVMKMLGRHELIAQLSLMGSSAVSLISLFLAVVLYGALMPKSLLHGSLTRSWGYSFVIACVVLCLHAVLTGVTCYYALGTEVMVMLKKLIYPRAVAACGFGVAALLFALIGLTTRYWKLLNRTEFHLGLFSGNFFFQDLTLADYTALSENVQFASTVAIGFAGMGFIAGMIATTTTGFIANGHVDALKGKIGLVAGASSVCSTFLYLFAIIFYAGLFPDPLVLTFSKRDVRTYDLDLGYSYVFMCLATIFMCVATGLVLWSTRGSEAYVHEGEFSSDPAKRERAQQIRDERFYERYDTQKGGRRSKSNRAQATPPHEQPEQEQLKLEQPRMPIHRKSAPV